MKKVLYCLLLLLLFPLAAVIVIVPMDSEKQYIFGLIAIAILFALGISKSHKTSMVMVFLSALMSTRYIYWRATETLSFNSEIEAILGIGLFAAEIYVWVILLLGYLQTSWPLKRTIEPMPDDVSLWPTVDIYVPSYNESLDVVRDTVLAAQCIDYPRDKIKSICSMTASAASLLCLRPMRAWVTSPVMTTAMRKRVTLTMRCASPKAS